MAVTNKLSPKEKLAAQVRQYEAAMAKVLADPADRKLRQAVGFIKSHLKTHCASYKLKVPDLTPLPPLPPLPDPKPHTGLQKPDEKTAQARAPRRPEEAVAVAPSIQSLASAIIGAAHHTYPDQAAAALEVEAAKEPEPSPYAPPTTQDLRDPLVQVDPDASFEEVLAQLDPIDAATTAIHLVEDGPDPLEVCASLRRIRRDLLALLPKVEDLDDRGRLVVEDDLHTLDHLLCAALNIVVERRVPMAG